MKNFTRSIFAAVILATLLVVVWNMKTDTNTWFILASLWAALVQIVVTGWDVVTYASNHEADPEPTQYTEAEPVVDKWAALKQATENPANEIRFSLSRLANKASARSTSDYDPLGPVTMD